MFKVKTGLGTDSHRFCEEALPDRPLILGGVEWEEALSLSGNSDADVVLHALTDAISSITGKTIIGQRADQLCQEGITNSSEYLKLALADLAPFKISNVALTLECKQPKIDPKVAKMRASIAALLGIDVDSVGITATSGEALSAVGRGEGIYCQALVTAILT